MRADIDTAALGKVWLVGAGPGAADLLTLRAARLIGSAEALLYDALVDEAVIALAPAAGLKIRTGKRAGRASMAQGTINALMLRLARKGLSVVRLKGGDPSIFGRVGEESAYLRGYGVPCEIVPGVTAASAAAAQFDFPLTYRGAAQRLILSTARLETDTLVENWQAAADPNTTLAIYMGGAAATELSHRLIAAGRSPSTPALVVESAGSPQARLRRGSLDRLGEMAISVEGGPILIVVGEVAALAEENAGAAWMDSAVALRA
jgi:uroporphyrin-III C-methyltransferase